MTIMSISLPKFLHPSVWRAVALQVLLVACAWMFFYHVSIDMLAYFSFNHETFWIFLPAGIRLVAVILFGWVGVVGLFIGSVLTPDDVPFSHVLLLSAVSALAPKLALKTGRWLLHLSETLQTLNPLHLMFLSLFTSNFNALMRVGILHLIGETQHLFNLVPMFVGDLVGTILVLYIVIIILFFASYFRV